MNNLNQLFNKLNSKVNGSTLGVFRLLFGLLLLEEFIYFHEYFLFSLSDSKILFSYDGFRWLEMLPIELISPFFYLMMLSSILLALGVFTRLNNIIVLLGFSYAFFIDKGHYNNHYYFYFLLLSLMLFVDCSWGGLQNKMKNLTVPYWQLLILQLQLFIVYFYGGIAKLDLDWLQGVPMNVWIYGITSDFPEFIQSIYRTDTATIVFSYIGLIFDLLVGFALFSRKFKRPFLIPIALFHLQNFVYFNIGTFPFAMLAATILFANPKYGEIIYNSVREGLFLKIIKFLKNKPLRNTWNWFRTKSTEVNFAKPLDTPRQKSSFVYFFLSVWFLFQFTFPFRHILYEGHPSWTGEGHLFAWRMMLVDTADGIRFWIEDKKTKTRYPVAIEHYMNYRQFYKMTRTPKEFLTIAHFIRDKVKDKTGEDPIVKMEVYKSVNFRPPMLLNDTTLNYSKVEYHAIKPATWINDWKRTDQEIAFDQEVYENWKPVVEKQQIDL